MGSGTGGRGRRGRSADCLGRICCPGLRTTDENEGGLTTAIFLEGGEL